MLLDFALIIIVSLCVFILSRLNSLYELKLINNSFGLALFSWLHGDVSSRTERETHQRVVLSLIHRHNAHNTCPDHQPGQSILPGGPSSHRISGISVEPETDNAFLYLGRGGARTSQHNLQTNQLWTTDALGNCYFLKGTDATCLIKNKIPGLPWWLTGQESTCQCRRHRFSPWSGKIPQATEQLSQCATTTEPVLQSPGPAILSPCVLQPMLCNKRSHQTEKPEHCN